MPEDLTISDIRFLGKTLAMIEVFSQITRIENNTFPASVLFPFGEELCRRSLTLECSMAKQATTTIPLYVRQEGIALLHNDCISEAERILRCN